MFRSREQLDGETFEHFMTDLNILINDCSYQADKPFEKVHDHIVYGIKSRKLRETMISNDSDLTLQKALDLGRMNELSQLQVKQMKRTCSVWCWEQTEDQMKAEGDSQ